MTSLIERVLYEQLRENFIAVHKSQELNKELGTWDRNILKVSEDKIDLVCKKIARNVTSFIETRKINGQTSSNQEIKDKIEAELNNI